MQEPTLHGEAFPSLPDTASASTQDAPLTLEAFEKGRIVFLDGLRGVAITVVMLFHAYVRWPAFYPYANAFADNRFLNTKIAGVNLFFSISGFVILMTLRKCRSFSDFITRRWFRLFPAMLVCSLVIYLTGGLFPERPQGDTHWLDLLPGITFIGDGPVSDHLWKLLPTTSGSSAKSIEGAFWSLYVEVKFYIVFGGAYFLLGERASFNLLFLLWALGKLASYNLLTRHFGPADIGGHALHATHEFLQITRIDAFSNFLDAKSYGYFIIGALLYLYNDTRSRKFFWLAAAMGIINCVSVPPELIPNLTLILLFLCAVQFIGVQRYLENRILIFIGFVSYPLYLLHENMMVAMIVKTGRLFPHLPAMLMPVLPICVVVLLAWIVAKYAEPKVRSLFDSRFRASRAVATQPARSSR